MLLVEYSTSIIAGYPRPKSHDPRTKRPPRYGGPKRPSTSVTRQPRTQPASGIQRPTSCGARLQRPATSASDVYPVSVSSCALARDSCSTSQSFYRPSSSMTYPQTQTPSACFARRRRVSILQRQNAVIYYVTSSAKKYLIAEQISLGLIRRRA